LGDGRVVEALGTGKVSLKMLFKVSGPKQACVQNVFYVPKLTCKNFLSVSSYR